MVMKKRSRIKRSSARKRATRKTTYSGFSLPFSFRRIILITTCIALFIVGYIFINGGGRQSVAGIAITKGLFAQATIDVPQIQGAVSYNIYYKQEDENDYKNAVREIPPSVDQYTITYLSRNAKYLYKVAAVDPSGGEFWFSEDKPLDNLQPM